MLTSGGGGNIFPRAGNHAGGAVLFNVGLTPVAVTLIRKGDD
jgi:hypothetical protein